MNKIVEVVAQHQQKKITVTKSNVLLKYLYTETQVYFYIIFQYLLFSKYIQKYYKISLFYRTCSNVKDNEEECESSKENTKASFDNQTL